MPVTETITENSTLRLNVPPGSFCVVIPTLNAAKDWDSLTISLLRSARPDQVLLIDSESTDGTAKLAAALGFRTVIQPRSTFNHGATRQLGVDLCPDAEILVYLTQDAILTDESSIPKLIRSFEDPDVSAAYGRQLPRPGAKPIEAHARQFNYPDRSQKRTLDSRKQLGIRAAFLSNSFAAYRRAALMQVGGFPSSVIFGEDMVTAARMLLAGYTIAYCAQATVYHSHGYSCLQEFRRSFDIGALHSLENWLMQEFGSAGGEGKRFVLSELGYLAQHDRLLLPSSLLRSSLKLTGYRLGRMHARLPLRWKRRLGMNSAFWS